MVITQTPLRISFAGGGTDLPSFYEHVERYGSGKVVNCAIDKYIFVIVKERFDDLICLNYTKREQVKAVKISAVHVLKHIPQPHRKIGEFSRRDIQHGLTLREQGNNVQHPVAGRERIQPVHRASLPNIALAGFFLRRH